MSKIETRMYERLHVARGYVFARCLRPDAEDIYGDTVVKIWEILRAGQVKKDGNLDAFICRIAHSVLCDYYKRQRTDKRNCNEQYIYHCTPTTRSPEREYEAKQENHIFLKKLGTLKSLYRKVIILLLYQSMKHWEIAYVLGIPRGTVSTLLFRARQKLGDIHLGKVREKCRRR